MRGIRGDLVKSESQFKFVLFDSKYVIVVMSALIIARMYNLHLLYLASDSYFFSSNISEILSMLTMTMVLLSSLLGSFYKYQGYNRRLLTRAFNVKRNKLSAEIREYNGK